MAYVTADENLPPLTEMDCLLELPAGGRIVHHEFQTFVHTRADGGKLYRIDSTGGSPRLVLVRRGA